VVGSRPDPATRDGNNLIVIGRPHWLRLLEVEAAA
jgi:hypothetical protein